MPTPHYKVEIDLDNDGRFDDDANGDITPDVLQVILNQGVNPDKHRAEAASLDLQVNNDGHKYSPSKSTSVLYPLLLPGRKMRFWMAYPFDNFDAVDGTNLDGRRPPNDDTFPAWEGDTTSFETDSSKLASTGADGSDLKAVLDFGESDCWIGVKFTKGQSDPGGGLVLRYTDANNYWLLTVDSSSFPTVRVQLYKVDSGSSSLELNQPASASGINTGDDFFLLAFLRGPEFHFFVLDAPDQAQFRYSPSSFSDTFNSSATKHGVGGFDLHPDDRWNDFGGWKAMFTGRIDTVQPQPVPGQNYATIRALDEFERFRKTLVLSKPSVYISGTIGDVLTTITDAADFSRTRALRGTFTTLIPSSDQFRAMTRDSLTELWQVQDDEAGLIFMNGLGELFVQSASYREEEPYSSLKATWQTPGPSGDQTDIAFAEVTWDDGKARVENAVYYEFSQVSEQAEAEVWRLDENFDIPNLQDENFEVTGPTGGTHYDATFVAITPEIQISNPRVPIPNTDLTINEQEDGSGFNLTSPLRSEAGTVSFNVSTGVLEDTGQDFTPLDSGFQGIVVFDASGNKAYGIGQRDSAEADNTKITIVDSINGSTAGPMDQDSAFNAGNTPLTYDGFRYGTELVDSAVGNYISIRVYSILNLLSPNGQYITLIRMLGSEQRLSNRIAARAEDAGSQTENGRRRVRHEALHISEFATARNRALKRLHLRSRAKERLGLLMHNSTRDALMNIIHREISDRVRVVYSDMGIDDDYHVEHRTVTLPNLRAGSYVECEWEITESVWGYVDRARADQTQAI